MAALRIALYNGKGGCGKTTLAWNLAMGLARRGATLLVDADPQGSLGDWADWADTGDYALEFCDWTAFQAGESKDHRYRVYDCPPRLEGEAIQAILGQADIVLLPVLPSPLDLWASRRSAELLRDWQDRGLGLRAYFVLNQVEATSALSRASQSAIAAMGLPVLATRIGRRAIYRSAAVEGLSVYHMGKQAAVARDEMERLIEEVLT